MRSSKISHFADKGNEYEALETLDGRQRRILRQNDDVYTLIPEQKTVFLEKRESKDSFPALLATPNRDVLDYYAPKVLPNERMAGFDCMVIELTPRDEYRFGYRLWADRNTGLLLRAQTLDAEGHLLEQAAFSQISIGVPSEKARIVHAIQATHGWHVIKPQIVPTHVPVGASTSTRKYRGSRRCVKCAARCARAPTASRWKSSRWYIQTAWPDFRYLSSRPRASARKATAAPARRTSSSSAMVITG
jgi:hypothetical protein